MLINISNILLKYGLNINGVIHGGGHYGEEYREYCKSNIHNQIWFEPQPDVFKIMERKVPSSEQVILCNKALGNDNTRMKMYCDSYNQGSSSLLKPKLHLTQFKHIKFEKEIMVDMVRIDDFIPKDNPYDFIYLDCQGYELEILKGAKDALNSIKCVMVEVSRDELYENNAMVEEIDDYLSNYNLHRVETNWEGGNWGDAFYVREDYLRKEK